MRATLARIRIQARRLSLPLALLYMALLAGMAASHRCAASSNAGHLPAGPGHSLSASEGVHDADACAGCAWALAAAPAPPEHGPAVSLPAGPTGAPAPEAAAPGRRFPFGFPTRGPPPA